MHLCEWRLQALLRHAYCCCCTCLALSDGRPSVVKDLNMLSWLRTSCSGTHGWPAAPLLLRRSSLAAAGAAAGWQHPSTCWARAVAAIAGGGQLAARRSSSSAARLQSAASDATDSSATVPCASGCWREAPGVSTAWQQQAWASECCCRRGSHGGRRRSLRAFQHQGTHPASSRAVTPRPSAPCCLRRRCSCLHNLTAVLAAQACQPRATQTSGAPGRCLPQVCCTRCCCRRCHCWPLQGPAGCCCCC